MFKDEITEREAVGRIALDESQALLNRFSTLVRESGTQAEREGAEYIIERLRALGVPVTVHEPDLYLSVPEKAELKLVPEGDVYFSRTPAFSASTGDAVVTGELYYVPSTYAAGTMTLFDTPTAATAGVTEGADDPVRGKIVLTEGYSTPGPVHAFERRGAIAQIYMHPGEQVHDGICTTIWGAPTPESLGRKPKTPIVCVNKADGLKLIERAKAGGQVAVKTQLREGWYPCLLPVAEIKGTQDPDEFLLVHGHYDSWDVGIGDNATGDAALLELARVLHESRGSLKRSVKIAWWPGHSTGRYAGSTWFADEFADEMDEWCFAQLNIDSPGCVDATSYEEVMWMAEADELCRTAIQDALGVPAKGLRPLRAGDYSFNQIGPTGFYMLLSNVPPEERKRRGFYAVGGCGGHPVWHTPLDVMDVADLKILENDLKVYITTIVRVLNAPLYPFDYSATAAEIRKAVEGYHAAAAGVVSFDDVASEVKALEGDIAAWRSAAEAAVGDGTNDAARRAANAAQRRLAKLLIPVNYARSERFDHDPALKFGAVPRLEAASHVAKAPEAMQPFIKVGLIREANKVKAWIRAARREVKQA